MSDIIQLLPDHVANQIAAGEVVQRPASVVKELLENAIDAKSKNIKLVIIDAGKTLIQVIDDGLGMSLTDARMCFERHATSKIAKAEDLFNLHTKGFRGEALASIAAVSQIDLKTKEENKELGTHIKIEGSQLISQENTATAKGTSVAVKNLFFNIPARRNFLKSNTVETRHIINEFQRVALAHPNISFSLHHNKNEIYHLPISNLRQRIVSIFGKNSNEKLVPISEKTDLVSIEGFITKAKFAKKKRGEQFFFVNHRFIRSAYLNHAVVSAFENLIPAGHHPGYFLFLTVPTNSIDINIHPTKTEIKFDDEKTLYAILRATVKHSLGQYHVAPVLDFNKDSSLETPYNYKNKPLSNPKIKVDKDFNPFNFNTTYQPSYTKKENKSWESLYSGLEKQEIQEIPKNKEKSLFKEEKTATKTYQIHKKYIISTIKSGVVYINQNLAHQRILYETLLANGTLKKAISQQLLFPLHISLEKADIILIKELKTDLENMGFLFDKIEPQNLIVKGIPTTALESQTSQILEQLLDDVKNNIPEKSFSKTDYTAKSLAKSLAIKNGTILNTKEQEEIVNNLFLCKQPNFSPYGKTTYVTIDLKEIDKKFN